MFLLNLDRDLMDAMTSALKTLGKVFQALPLTEQLRVIRPFLREQEKRDAKRLGPYRKAA